MPQSLTPIVTNAHSLLKYQTNQAIHLEINDKIRACIKSNHLIHEVAKFLQLVTKYSSIVTLY